MSDKRGFTVRTVYTVILYTNNNIHNILLSLYCTCRNTQFYTLVYYDNTVLMVQIETEMIVYTNRPKYQHHMIIHFEKYKDYARG